MNRLVVSLMSFVVVAQFGFGTKVTAQGVAENPRIEIESFRSTEEKNLLLQTEEQSINDELSAKYLQHRKTALSLWRDIIRENPETRAAAEARYKTAVFVWRNGKEAEEKAAQMLDEALEIFAAGKASDPILQARIALLAGEIALSRTDFGLAEQLFHNVIENASKLGEGSEYFTRATLGLGDVHFLKNSFEKALKFYSDAYENIAKAPELSQARQQNILPVAVVRLAWGNFRSGNYEATLTWIKAFFHNQAFFKGLIGELLVKDLVRIGGIALFERNSGEIFATYAKDALAGPTLRFMICQSLGSFVNAGRGVEGDALAESLQTAFWMTGELPCFLNQWLENAAKLPSAVHWHEVAARGIEQIRKGSPWFLAHRLDAAMEQIRQRVVNGSGAAAAEHFFSRGLTSGNPGDFLRSLSLYEAVIAESDLPSQMSMEHFHAADAAFRGGDVERAWEHVQESIRFAQDSDLQKQALYLAVSISLSQAGGAAVRSDAMQLRYEQAVDAFVRVFPKEKSAHIALLESARRAQMLRDINEARIRLERLLALLPSDDSKVATEREQALLAFIALNAQDRDTAVAADSLRNLVRQIDVKTFSKSVKKQLDAAYAAVIRTRAADLRRAGKLEDAAVLLADFSLANVVNSETPGILIDAMRQYALLLQWNEVLRCAKLFEEHYADNSLFDNAIYWRGRALESTLSFLTALDAFERVGLSKSSHLNIAEQRDSLERGVLIASELGEKSRAAVLQEKLADASHFADEKERWLLDSAESYLASGRFAKALQLFDRIKWKSRVSEEHRLQAVVGSIDARLKMSDHFVVARRELETWLSNFRKMAKSLKNPQFVSSLGTRAIELAVATDRTELSNIVAKGHGDYELENLARVRSLSAGAAHRMQNLVGIARIEEVGMFHTARLNLELASWLNISAARERSTGKGTGDTLIRQADALQTGAKRLFFSALEKSHRGDLFRDKIMLELRNISDFRSGRMPDSSPVSGESFLREQKIFDAVVAGVSEQGERALLSAALDWFELGNYDKAFEKAHAAWELIETNRIRTLDEDLTQTPVREAALILALVHLKTQRWQDGLEILERLVRLNSQWDTPYYVLGEYYLQRGAARLAVKVAQKGVGFGAEKSDARMFVLWAQAERELGNQAEARRLITQAGKRFPTDGQTSLWQGLLDYDEGNRQSACEAFVLAKERMPESPAAAHNVAVCLLDKGDWDGAADVLRLTMRKSPSARHLKVLLGTVEQRRGHYAEARRLWTDWLGTSGLGDPERAAVLSAIAELGRASEQVPEKMLARPRL